MKHKNDKTSKTSYAHNAPKFDAASHNAARKAAPERVAHAARDMVVKTTERFKPYSKAKSSRV
jgi:hypothetical protein